mgnify:FL=1
MRITLNEPFAEMCGKLDKHHYIRRSPSGKFFLQRTPQKATAKQQKARAHFGYLYGTCHRKSRNTH